MQRRKVTRFLAGFLSALIVFTSSGTEQLVYAAEVSQTVEQTQETVDEEVQQEENHEEVQEETESSDDVSSETETKGESAPAENTVTATEQSTGGIIASGETDNYPGKTQWVIDETGKLIVTGTGDYRGREIPWHEYGEYIYTAKISVKNMIYARDLFSGCYNLKEIDFSEFDRVLLLDEPIKGKISLPLDNNQASDS